MKKESKKAKKNRNIELIAPLEGELLSTLRSLLCEKMPAGKIKSLLEHRAVSVNGRVSTAFDLPVSAGDVIKVSLSHAGDPPPFEILYEDESLIAINKPSGLLSVATDREKDVTAFRILRESGREVYTVHRLDRDTSGVLIFAKSRETRDIMQENWDERVIKRGYIAVCEGVFEKKSGVIESSLAETSTHIMYSTKQGGKKAVTEYTVVRENDRYSLLDIRILTGRKNQIRAHMKECGHPVAGDKKYGASADPLRRLALHAAELTFIHPVSGERITVKSEPPFDLPRTGKKRPER